MYKRIDPIYMIQNKRLYTVSAISDVGRQNNFEQHIHVHVYLVREILLQTKILVWNDHLPSRRYNLELNL